MAQWLKREPGYFCPLCPDHEDDVFIWNDILQAPICQGCFHELWNDVYGNDSRPESMLLDRLERLTPLQYEEYCLIEVESAVKDMMGQPDANQESLKDYIAEVSRLKALIKSWCHRK